MDNIISKDSDWVYEEEKIQERVVRTTNSVDLGKYGATICNEYDIVYYDTTQYPIDVALCRAYAGLKIGGQMIIPKPFSFGEYETLALSLFTKTETKKEITLIKKDV